MLRPLSGSLGSTLPLGSALESSPCWAKSSKLGPEAVELLVLGSGKFGSGRIEVICHGSLRKLQSGPVS